MIPLILVSKDLDLQEKFISDFILQKKILPYLVFRIRPVKTEISIDQIREIRREIIVFSKDERLFVIYSFETAPDEAQNALLKTLEEKSRGNQFVLLAASINQVLPTIQSRCKVIILDNKIKTDIDKKILSLINAIISPTDYSFLADKSIAGINKQEALILVDQLLDYYHKNWLRAPKFSPVIVKKCLTARNLIQKNNLNPQLAIDNLLIFINKIYSMKV